MIGNRKWFGIIGRNGKAGGPSIAAAGIIPRIFVNGSSRSGILGATLDFQVSCRCGQQVVVTAASAGAEVVCRCGATVTVPRLSELRQRAGQGAYEAGVVDSIHRMIAAGELPAGDICAYSGVITRDVFDLEVECERIWSARLGHPVLDTIVSLPLAILSPLTTMARLSEEEKIETSVGREVVVATPLRVSRDYHAKLARAGQWRLRRLLRTVPIYAKLLDEYRRARVVAPGAAKPRE